MATLALVVLRDIIVHIGMVALYIIPRIQTKLVAWAFTLVGGGKIVDFYRKW